MFDFIDGDLKDIKEIHKKTKTDVKEEIKEENIEERLGKLKELFEKKLITRKVYEEKMKDIL
jgi:hypothetical protein